MTAEEKVVSALRKLMEFSGEITLDTHLLDDLGMDSVKLIELTVALHTQHGVDLGRKAAQKNLTPTTVGDLVSLVE